MRREWIDSHRKLLLGEIAEVQPRVQHARKMLRVDREAGSEIIAKADIGNWSGEFKQWYQLGKDLENWGDYDNAVSVYRQAMTQPGGHQARYTDACLRWADCLRQADREEESEDPLNVLLRRFPDVKSAAVKAQQQLCELYRPDEGKGNRARYVAEVHRFLRRYPDQSRAYAQLQEMQSLAEESGDVRGVVDSLSQQIQEAESPKARRQLALTRARTLYGAGQYHQALSSLEEFPMDHTEAAILRARCARQLIDYPTALHHLDQVRDNSDYGETSEKTPPLALMMSLIQFQTSQEDYADAYELLSEAEELLGDTLSGEEEVKLTLARVDVMIAEGDTSSAVPIIKDVQNETEGSSLYWVAEVQRAKIDFTEERYEEALERLEEVAELEEPESAARALFWIGNTYLQMDETDSAIESFRELWSNYGDDDLVIQAIYLIGRTYRERGDFIDAINLFESVGVMRGSKRTRIVPGEELTLKVRDPDYAVGTGRKHMNVDVTTRQGDSEQVRLDMHAISDSLFVGAIETRLGDAEPDNEVLELRGDDVVTVTYIDQFGEMKVTYEDSDINMDRSRDLSKDDRNIAPKGGTTLFSEGEVENVERLTDEETEEPAQGRLGPEENRSFAMGARFIRPTMINAIRVHIGERAPANLKIQTLKEGSESEDDDAWITREETESLDANEWHDFTITPTTTQSVRLIVEDDPDARGWRHITEMEIIEGSGRMDWDEADIEVAEPTEKSFKLHVVDNGELELSSVGFDDDEEDDERWLALEAEREREEKQHELAVDMQRRREGNIMPGNVAFARIFDKAYSVSGERDTLRALVRATAKIDDQEVVNDELEVEFTETSPNSGEFRALVETTRGGPTARASGTAEGFSAAAAIDESMESTWRGRADETDNVWIEVDLKDLHTITRVSWTRGDEDNDRIIKQGTVKIYGDQRTKELDIDNKESSPEVALDIDDPISARYVRIIARDYEDNSPEIAQITVEDEGGDTLVPRATPQRDEDRPLELNVGDSMVMEYLDEQNVTPGEPTRRESSALTVRYDDADVFIAYAEEEEDQTEYRRTNRIVAGEPFQVLIQD
ncbi:MAG: tetratricopeptide repeat protein, partial [Planctomycetota bacterium]